MIQRFIACWLALVVVCLLACGCDSQITADVEENAADKSVVDAEPFNPPTLEQLDNLVEWEDRPVIDALQLLQTQLATSEPLVSMETALAMKNGTGDDNAKILSALDRQPENRDQVDWNAQFTRHLLGDVNSMNGIMRNTTHEFDVAPVINFCLLGFDWNLQAFADANIVARWQSSSDRMYDRITLRRDCTWSDGKPVTAHDVQFSFQAIMNPKIPVPAERSSVEKLRGVSAYDDETVVFFHKEPLATNDWNILFRIIPQHVFEPLYAQLKAISFTELQQKPEFQLTELTPVTGGPYRVVSRTRNQQIVCKRRKEWYLQGDKQVRAKPYFEEVRFRVIEDPNTALLALVSGNIDDYEIHMEQWASQTGGEDFYARNTKVRATEWTYFCFGWNNDSDASPFFKDRRVREAMSYALDYHELLNTLLYGLCEPCAGIFYPTAWMAPKTPLVPYRQDLDKAAALLDDAGWTDSDNDGVRDRVIDGRPIPFEFNMVVRQDAERIRICELMRFNLEQIGVICNIQPLEATVFYERTMNKQFQAYYGGWGSGSDPDSTDNIWMTKAIADGRNFLRYSNAAVDRLYDEARKELDRERRAELYGRIDELIYRDQPCTFLFWRSAFYGFNNRLRGYHFSPLGPYHYDPGFGSIWSFN